MQKPVKASPKQLAALECLAKGAFHPDFVKEEDGWYARWLANDGSDNTWVDYFARRAVVKPSTMHAERQTYETLHDAWLAALKSTTGLVVWDAAECAEFAGELAGWHGEPEATRVRSAMTFHFDPATLGLSVAEPKGRAALKALGQAVHIFGALRGLKRVAPSSTSTSSLHLLSMKLEPGEAEVLIRSAARELVEAGYQVEGVDVKVPVEMSAEIDGPSDEEVRIVYSVTVAGEKVSAEEIRFLLDQQSTLVFFRNRWIEVDRNILRECLRALEKVHGRDMGRNEALAFAAGLGHVGREELKEVAAKGWIRGLLNELKAKKESGPPPTVVGVIPGFTGELKPYQRIGVGWLDFLTRNNFGALLADDMGLGKTIQTIAWLMLNRPAGSEPALVVAPLTLLANWAKEFQRFAPGLRIYVHHGETRAVGARFTRRYHNHDVVITSYALLVKDYADFSSHRWDALVLDEAQSIKNADTKVAAAVCRLRPRRRVALTGTPIENSLSDIWSIEEFLNPGLLGERADFLERFVKPLAANPSASVGRRLKHALEPFILRRLKTDPGIAAELGEKREEREYCTLTDTERFDYERALHEFSRSKRTQGDAFALITSLKLICDGEGKLDRLAQLVRGIFEGGESVLIFTQYAKVGAAIARRLEREFGRRFPFLHGALTPKGREHEIAEFQNDPGASAFILSLRAGGFGLNLVKATHVIHYDRWWNPAVENQATDRAHRIGQHENVLVHNFVTVGTIEEHVEEVLERKENLASLMSAGSPEFLKLVGLT